MRCVNFGVDDPLAKTQVAFTKISPTADALYGLPCTRSSHGVSIVDKGRRLVIFGGEHVARTPLDSNQSLWLALLDEKTQEWQWQCVVTPREMPMPDKRVAHSQTVVGDRYVYIFGGRAGITMEEAAMNDLWKFDTQEFTWTAVEATEGTAPEKRSFHRMIAIGDLLYVFGGCSANHGRLADLHRFNTKTRVWTAMGVSKLAGRGGPNLLALADENIGVVAGFAGKETRDSQIFYNSKLSWEENVKDLVKLKPRSVCTSDSLPSIGVCVVFGGEVDPSDKGHEGAGGFENDVVILNYKNADVVATHPAKNDNWPTHRGWSDSAAHDSGNGGQVYIFGGLTGDDENPIRLNDLWRMDVSQPKE